ncbi:MAG: hypothetical protein JWN54_3617 [Mycobacterium sp.]|nr:hypothetical protein [Mycobacterium sp.]
MDDHRDCGVRYEVLGPLRVSRGDAAVDLGSVQQRVVLAVLLTHANRPLGREQLIAGVWGWEAPAYAVNLVQKHVSELRRALEPDRSAHGPSRVLAWTQAGYLLTVPPDCLDLAVLDRTLEEAAAARAAGDLAAASDDLHRALRLWRGPLCDGLVSPLLDAERDRLAERWIATVEDRIELDLALGRHFEVVGELRRLLADHPLRERLRALLLLALYRSGRKAEALAAYRDARVQLRDELGIEPGTELAHLHQQILESDPSLAAPSAAVVVQVSTGPYGAAPPAQLPHGMPDFTGRDAELDCLDSLLDSDGARDAVTITAITGTAGVGKTALAVHWAHQVRDRFADGQLYVNLRGFDPTGAAMEPPEAIRGFLDAFAVPTARIPVSLEAQAALYRSLLAGRRVLIVLDNAGDADQVRPLLPGAAGCFVVVTSRNELTGLVAAEDAQSLPVDLLPAAEARQLLGRRLGTARLAAEPVAVDDIVEFCARLPLALTIVAARAATHPHFPLAAIAEELRDSLDPLDALDSEDKATDVRAVFSWSYRRLSDGAQHLFRLLGLHAGPDISTPAAASLAGVVPARVRPLLGQLARAHLVEERSPGRFAFHDLLRAYAGEQAELVDDAADRHVAIRRALDHYLGTAYRAGLLLNPHQDDPITPVPAEAGATPGVVADKAGALRWFTREHPVLLAALRQAGDAGFDTHVWQLSWTLMAYFEYQGHWHDWAETQRAALAAAGRLGDRHAVALTGRHLGRAVTRLGRYDEGRAVLRQALERYEALEDAAGQAHVHRALSWQSDLRGHHREGLVHAEQALELFRTAGHRTGEARALNAIGWFHAQLGDYERALDTCRQALALQQEIGDRFGEAETWDSLGCAHQHLGHPEDSAAAYLRAVDLYREIGDRYNEADSLANLGDAHLASGDPEAAHAAWRHALVMLDQLAHPGAAVIRAKVQALEQRGPHEGHSPTSV